MQFGKNHVVTGDPNSSFFRPAGSCGRNDLTSHIIEDWGTGSTTTQRSPDRDGIGVNKDGRESATPFSY